jgi:hypothetical protein
MEAKSVPGLNFGAYSPQMIRGELRYTLAYLSANKLNESAKW